MPRYSDPWSANSRPAIGLGHTSYAQPQQQAASDVWENATQSYGSGSAYSSGQQSWRDSSARYEGYGGNTTTRGAAYAEDPYYAQPAASAATRQAYYGDYDSAQQAPQSQYGEYNVANPLNQVAGYGADYRPGYDRPAYGSYQAPAAAPRPLFEANPQQYYQQRRRGNGAGAYFSEGRNQRNFGPPKTQQRPEKRKRDQPPRQRQQQNRNSPQKQNFRKNDEKPKNGNSNGKADGEPEEKRQNVDSRFLFEKTDNVAELFQKCESLGEARHRQFRYKIYRVLNTVGLEFITLTEQAGTFAKNGSISMKVLLKSFFPQVFIGEADGNEHENVCYKASVQLATKLHEFGLISCSTIANFYNKKLHYKTELFENAKAKFQVLIDEVAKEEFTPEFKSGKEESEEQMQKLKQCISSAADKIKILEQEKEAQKAAKAEAKSAEQSAPAESTATENTAVENAKTEPENGQAEAKPAAEPNPTVEEPAKVESTEAEPAKTE